MAMWDIHARMPKPQPCLLQLLANSNAFHFAEGVKIEGRQVTRVVRIRIPDLCLEFHHPLLFTLPKGLQIMQTLVSICIFLCMLGSKCSHHQRAICLLALD